ncbi:hypothetical protein [Clostridium sp.]|jgi:hypothetical protein|uniref:hypothetical protein n=1 Tax=Clostridium sp. TaxID=1506 RepID=UPI003EEC0F3E
MKIKAACIIFLGVCIIGFYGVFGTTPVVQVFNMSQKQPMISQGKLKIINAVSVVKRGETGLITIQGIPNTRYNITTSYKIKDKTIPVIQWRKTDGIGMTTFNWIVNVKTIAGTYDATISGGGDILKTNHTVVPR